MSYVNNLGAITGGSKSGDGDLNNINIQMNDTEGQVDTEAPVQGKQKQPNSK